ncbi:MAG: histone deacetylase [bacterium]|nr:histone deacetylase [bacterium]
MPPIPLVYSNDYYGDLKGHIFPIEKYRLIYETLRDEGCLGDVLAPVPATREQLALVHTEEYLDDLYAARVTPRTMRSEMIINEEVIRGFIMGAGGSIVAMRAALERGGPAMNCGGGLHHAFPDHAEGFCYINDVVLAVRVAQEEGLAQRWAVIDVDLHQGNGTAYIFRDDAQVFTFSIHQENLYPIKQRSDLDIGLGDNTGDKEYIEKLGTAIPRILDEHKPEAVVYVAGADPYIGDQLGFLRLSFEGLLGRDRMVLGGCAERGLPVVILLAGGYAADTMDTVRVHVNTYKVAGEYDSSR